MNPLIHIVDDDEAIRKSLCWLIGSVGLETKSYATADEFIEHYIDDRPGCLLLDIRMPGLSGLDLQDALTDLKTSIPIIFLTGHGDVPIAVRAFKGGAFDFLQKPCNDQILLDRINDAIKYHQKKRSQQSEINNIKQRINNLTKREYQVAEGVSQGLHNKDIAKNLGISPKTVEVYRHNALQKMHANSTAELTRLWILGEQHGGLIQQDSAKGINIKEVKQ